MEPDEIEKTPSSTESEREYGCGMRGRGGLLRVLLLVAGAIAIIGLLVWGFTSAG